MSTNTCTVNLTIGDSSVEKQCSPGTTILEILNEKESAHVYTPCGGKGTCGKCKVIARGKLSPISEGEKKKLSQSEQEKGFRLACTAKIEGNCSVTLEEETSMVQIQEGGVEFDIDLAPPVKKSPLFLDKPCLEDQTDDFARIKEGLGKSELRGDLSLLRDLPEKVREKDYQLTAVYTEEELIEVEAGDSSEKNYGVAIDIGTTTVVAYLMDLTTGKRMGVNSGLNSQKRFGQDVISRIQHTIEKKEGLKECQSAIIEQLDRMIEKVCETSNVEKSAVYSVTIAGNTTMMHLVAGLPPKYIATVPFIPAAKETLRVKASDLGLHLARGTQVFLLPSISGYIGADIVAGVLASKLHRDEPTALLIDIGTNGEIVLGNKEGIVSCSTAAGPAFEGATIRHGVGGIAGAINTISLNTDVSYTTIGDLPPVGICGSGIVDGMAQLLEKGIIDASGRMLGEDEVPEETKKLFKDRITRVDDRPAFLLASAEETENGEPIYLTQSDVREVQLAKASFAAGISTLIQHTSRTKDDIDVLYIAGGFGSYIDKHNAAVIGLIPPEMEAKIKVIGNAAGSGAIMALASEQELKECNTIIDMAEYVELSSSPSFQDEYMANMTFGSL